MGRPVADHFSFDDRQRKRRRRRPQRSGRHAIASYANTHGHENDHARHRPAALQAARYRRVASASRLTAQAGFAPYTAAGSTIRSAITFTPSAVTSRKKQLL